MARLKTAIDGRDQHIKTLRGVILILVGVLGYSLYGWSLSPNRILLDIPPDLSQGSSQKIGERLPASVFSFGWYITQQLHNWPVDGREDYKARIQQLQCYLTPSYQAELLRDFDKRNRRNELSRTRSITEMAGHGYDPRRVYIESKDRWVAFYDARIVETFRGETVKDVFVRYPIRVVQDTSDRECNPWSLRLDGYYDQPRRLEGKAAEMNVRDTSGEIERI